MTTFYAMPPADIHELLEDLKDADLVHHLAVVACTLRDLQHDRKEAV